MMPPIFRCCNLFYDLPVELLKLNCLKQMLETRFPGYDDEDKGRALFEGLSLEGLSVFALVGVKPVTTPTPPVVIPVSVLEPASPTAPNHTETTTPTDMQPNVGGAEGNYWWILRLGLGLTVVGCPAWVYLRRLNR